MGCSVVDISGLWPSRPGLYICVCASSDVLVVEELYWFRCSGIIVGLEAHTLNGFSLAIVWRGRGGCTQVVLVGRAARPSVSSGQLPGVLLGL